MKLRNRNNKKNKGYYFAGISSYSEFPGKLQNPMDDKFHERRNHDYLSMVSSWLYCHRELPLKLQEHPMPKLLMTEADLKNVDPGNYVTSYIPKEAVTQIIDLKKL